MGGFERGMKTTSKNGESTLKQRAQTVSSAYKVQRTTNLDSAAEVRYDFRFGDSLLGILHFFRNLKND